MEDLEIQEINGRCVWKAGMQGIDEHRNLDFHSPYGCSKGAADQYCRDYARIYGLKTLVMRMSCIYGPRQFGVEDQGWVAWFCIAAASGKTITLYGNGKQVRDVLHIDDLVRLYEAAYERAEQNRGEVFNVGGGPENTLSLLELISQLGTVSGRAVPVRFEGPRPGDQPVYVSDIARARNTFGWSPTISPEAGVRDLYEWVVAHNETPP
jgi:CDP-paratose 2-epimerase